MINFKILTNATLTKAQSTRYSYSFGFWKVQCVKSVIFVAF